ncbi:GATA zinc finger domain-containing protein 14 [Octopus bimaculoides]|nr:GATA zinc finger domain-containing protein 14 [Octopus bimaculoides]|eukprot:XP_014783381.1 PREDICTED: GATA zinc finger domain-containing protein 14-like [Octopus bimaculoides]
MCVRRSDQRRLLKKETLRKPLNSQCSGSDDRLFRFSHPEQRGRGVSLEPDDKLSAMTAVASIGATMHDSNVTASLHRANLPSLRPVELRTTPTSIFKKSFQALAKAASLDGQDNEDGFDDSCSEDTDIYCNNRCSISTAEMSSATAAHVSNNVFNGEHFQGFSHFRNHSNLANSTVICNNVMKSNYHDGHTNVNSNNDDDDDDNNNNNKNDNNDDDDCVADDDDFSDHDSHYSADLEEVYFPVLNYPRRPESPNASKQLIDFAQLISADIQKFFGRKHGDEDSCDIYEDKYNRLRAVDGGIDRAREKMFCAIYLHSDFKSRHIILNL